MVGDEVENLDRMVKQYIVSGLEEGGGLKEFIVFN